VERKNLGDKKVKSMLWRRSELLPIALIAAIAPVHEIPRAALNDSTEHNSWVEGSAKEQKY